MAHDLERIIEQSRFRPAAWEAATGEATQPYPFWWLFNAAAQAALGNLGQASIQVRSDRRTMREMRPPLPPLAGAEHAMALAFKAVMNRLARVYSTAGETSDVLVLLPQRGWDGHGHAHDSRRNEYLGPVIRELEIRDRSVSTMMLMLQGSRGKFRALARALRRGRMQGPPNHWLDAYWNRDAFQAMVETSGHFRRLFRRTPLEDLGFDVEAGAASRFRRWLTSQSVRLGFFAGLYVCIARVIAETRPRALLLTMESHPDSRLAVAAARALGIPSVSMQHGWLSSRHAGYFFVERDAPPTILKAAQIAMPDHLAVYGPMFRDLLVEHGPWPAACVHATGTPRYDRAHAMDTEALRDALVRPGLSADRPWILWATQTHGLSRHENQANVKAVATAMESIPDAHWVVKLHPMEPPAATLYAPLKRQGAIIVGGEEDMLHWIAASDVLVTKNSTCAIEAAALDRPVMVLNLTGEDDGADFVESGIARPARQADDIARTLKELLEDPRDLRRARTRYTRDTLGSIDGRASSRVADLIEATMRP